MDSSTSPHSSGHIDDLFNRTTSSYDNTLMKALAVQQISRSGYARAGIILVGISVLGIASNLCVFLVIIRNRRLQTPINVMVLSLSLSKNLKFCPC